MLRLAPLSISSSNPKNHGRGYSLNSSIVLALISSRKHCPRSSLSKLERGQHPRLFKSVDNGALTQHCSLPQIRSQVQRKLEEIDGELRDMPEPPTINALHIVIGTLSKFSAIMQKQVEGSQPYHALRLTWKQHCQTFKDAITSLRPTLIRKTDAEIAAAACVPMPQPKFNGTPSKREHADAIAIDSDSDCEISVAPEPTPSKKPRMMANAGTPVLRTPQKRRPVKPDGRVQPRNSH